MKLLAYLSAGVALFGLSACEVTVKDSASGEDETNQQVTRPGPAPAPQRQSVGQDAGEGATNPDAIRRANEIALMFGNDQLRAQARQQAMRQFENLRYEVDISDRQLRIYRGDGVIETHEVAVGTEEWPTPTGEWSLHRVDLNPEWIPPKDEKWAEEETRKAPGDPENPMGRARLVYRMPNTIHGTNDLASLGKASSHGSIRVANEVSIRLAEMLLRAGGSWQGQQWFQKMTENRTEEYQVKLENPIPIKVQE